MHGGTTRDVAYRCVYVAATPAHGRALEQCHLMKDDIMPPPGNDTQSACPDCTIVALTIAEQSTFLLARLF